MTNILNNSPAGNFYFDAGCCESYNTFTYSDLVDVLHICRKVALAALQASLWRRGLLGS